LEYLEERALLDAAGTGLIAGSSGNLSLNSNFNFASNGIILQTPGFSTGAGTANGANAQHALDLSGLANGSSAQASSSAFLAQNSTSAQFRLFAVNSQGPDFQFFQLSQSNFLTQSFGFGSGTQPNAPWRPNAYNLGLANRQFNYSSQADLGFQSVPPWTIPIAQAQPKEQLGDEDGATEETVEQALVQRSSDEQEQTPQKRMDTDDSYLNESFKASQEKMASKKESLADQALSQDSAIPDALWLTALAPVPMTALVAGIPGAGAEGEGGDVGAAAPE
jgi:hypothetical protein